MLLLVLLPSLLVSFLFFGGWLSSPWGSICFGCRQLLLQLLMLVVLMLVLVVMLLVVVTGVSGCVVVGNGGVVLVLLFCYSVALL